MGSYKLQKKSKSSFYIKGTLSLSLSLFLALSFFSYSPYDPSFNSFGTSLKVSNFCGYAGAFLADLLFQGFGIASWFFIPLGLYLSLQYFRFAFRSLFLKVFLLFCPLFISLSSFLNLIFPEMLFYEKSISLGGALATVIVGALNPIFHVAGSSLILLSIFLLSLLIYGGRSFLQAVYKIQQASLHFWNLFLFVLFFSASFLKKRWMKLIERDWAFLFSKIEKSIFKKSESSSPQDFISQEEDKKQDLAKDSLEPQLFSYNSQQPLEEQKEDDEETLEEELEENPEEASEENLETTKTTATKMFTEKDRPSLNLLNDSPIQGDKINKTEVDRLAKKLMGKLSQFSIGGSITAIKTGPAVIMFEFKPDESVKLSRIKEMADDIKMAIASESVRIIAPIPGRDVVGIEASRPSREMVYLKDILEKADCSHQALPLVLGVRYDNVVAIKDLARIPHLLIAGTTGSGKSVFVISFIMGLLFRHTPQTLRLILIDPKRVDLSFFEGIPHLLAPIMTSCSEALCGLKWAILEMDKRYRSLAQFGVRDISSFNKVVAKLNAKEKRKHELNQEELPKDQVYYFKHLPYICIIVEEFGDLMADIQFKRDIESSVNRLAQKARASGMHLVLAMQSPRKDVVTGLIKTNISGRISFKVASGTDSRIILDDVGAERLLSRGDMLFLEPGTPKSVRYHSPFVSEKEVQAVVRHWKNQSEVCYEESLVQSSKSGSSLGQAKTHSFDQDPMHAQILNFVHTCEFVSASLLQKKFRIGYPRAARLIEVLHEEGAIGPPHGSKPREVLK